MEDPRKWCPVFCLVAAPIGYRQLDSGILVGDCDVILWTRTGVHFTGDVRHAVGRLSLNAVEWRMVMSRGPDERTQMHAVSTLLSTCQGMSNRVRNDPRQGGEHGRLADKRWTRLTLASTIVRRTSGNTWGATNICGWRPRPASGTSGPLAKAKRKYPAAVQLPDAVQLEDVQKFLPERCRMGIDRLDRSWRLSAWATGQRELETRVNFVQCCLLLTKTSVKPLRQNFAA